MVETDTGLISCEGLPHGRPQALGSGWWVQWAQGVETDLVQHLAPPLTDQSWVGFPGLLPCLQGGGNVTVTLEGRGEGRT